MITLKRAKFEKLKIGEIGFNIRVLNIFDKHGIRKGEDILNYKMSELKEFEGFGLGCEKEVEFVLQDYKQELQP
jgi:DNA-directed RNA polymerase alpha subunit